jgi:hypothetical protein
MALIAFTIAAAFALHRYNRERAEYRAEQRAGWEHYNHGIWIKHEAGGIWWGSDPAGSSGSCAAFIPDKAQ